QAQEIFKGIKDALDANGAKIFLERIFATTESFDELLAIRSDVYHDIDDGVGPTCLSVPEGINGKLAGVHLHAITNCDEMKTIGNDTEPLGRIATVGDISYLTLSGVTAGRKETAKEQSEEMFHTAENIMKENGIDFLAVPRTWMWLRDILDWYDVFNLVRNDFFIERGLIQKGAPNKMPASTGIGIGPSSGEYCTMDLTAIIKPAGAVDYLDVSGKQESAYDYGSAFSRAASVPTPAGTTFFISGTASIDEAGATTNLGDAEKQIEDTIINVRAVLGEMGCQDKDMVQTFVYCKTPEIEKLFCEKFFDLPWPMITCVADVCRGDLLFEIEATAMQAG
ncbi:MAG: hypothetical protein KAJ07_05340, partial [Planctomycetes bacterium]|nr:hypothetical protein [Planctomycetota bacterium]